MKQTIYIISILFLLLDLSEQKQEIVKSGTKNCDDNWLWSDDLGYVHFATELMQWNEAQNYCGNLCPEGIGLGRSHMVEIFTEGQHKYLQEKAEEYETFVGKVSWGIGLVNVGGSDFSKWIWSYSLLTPGFTQWNGTATPKAGFSAVMSSNEYDSGISYNWNPVPMTYEFYPICQYGYEIITTPTPPTTPATTTTTIFKSTTTDMSSCGKDCGSDSGCHGTCSRCYWSNLTERFRCG